MDAAAAGRALGPAVASQSDLVRGVVRHRRRGGLVGDRVNLGFVVETERQVEEHLTTHLDRLPESDGRSRAIVDAMRADEARHGAMAQEAGAIGLPPPVPSLMRMAAGVMKAIAFRI